MYAVVENKKQQFRAAVGERIRIPFNTALKPGEQVVFDRVCLVTGKDGAIGTPYVEGAEVAGVVVGEVRGPKLYIQKFKRRKNMRRRTGFKARYTEVRVQEIRVGGTAVDSAAS